MVAEKKVKIVQEIQKLAKCHKVIGVLNMHKMPAKQLQQIKMKLKDKAVIKMAKKTLIKKALEDKPKLLEEIKDEPALLFSNDNPFKLFSFLKKNQSPAAAKPGDTANEDIVVKAGKTNLTPGPAISQLAGAGIKTKVDGGTLTIENDVVVLKQGEEVTDKLATIFNMLGLEPMKIGLDMTAVYEDGTIFGRDVLDINTDEYVAWIQTCATEALNLSVNAGYYTDENIIIAISTAVTNSRVVATTANIITSENVGEILLKASKEAKLLDELSSSVLEKGG
jgi:large subunit ribosomal protein L10